MLPGFAKRSQDSPWHFGHSFGGVTTPSGSKPQHRHWTWNTATLVMDASKGLYVANCPSEAKRSMLIDILTLILSSGYTHSTDSVSHKMQPPCQPLRILKKRRVVCRNHVAPRKKAPGSQSQGFRTNCRYRDVSVDGPSESRR